MKKDKNSIINVMVIHAADIMDAKADELDATAEYLLENNCPIRANSLKVESAEIRAITTIIRRREGSWA